MAVSYVSKTPYRSKTTAHLIGQPGVFNVNNFIAPSHQYAGGVGLTVRNDHGVLVLSRLNGGLGSGYRAIEVSFR